MRARNLKPAIFKNEELAQLGPWHHILFTGLWCLADRKGRLEDRPGRIEAELFPFKFQRVNIQKLLHELSNCPEQFITRYEKGGKKYIQVNAFLEHQYPHLREADSTIPAPDKHSAGTSLDRLNPDVLNPESPILNPDNTPAVPAGAFELIWTRYPRKIGKDESRDKFKAQVKTFQDWLDIQNAVSRFIAKLQTDKTEEKFIPHGSTWFNRRWRDWVNYTEGSHGTNGSAGISHYADIAKRARQALGLREPPPGGPLHAGLRGLPDVQPKAEDVDGTGERGDVAALEILRGAGLEIKSGR